ncbi:WD repeat- and FYVE domain-containing protein 4 [Bagarius yarrelli]|uniref:WD repeat-and FYVE domain-containing protein 4 n=1 Tax=Bagarius yarrelli TaxID=175774 RepID=A0A556TN35_BAGYA|nr:WD repeat- and FYVE domain-containing protein 4 [Bagarius yarrelli]
MERINKETGELSASGESIESTELKSDKPQTEPGHEENARAVLDAVTALKEQLLKLVRAKIEQREEQLLILLPMFIQVCDSSGIIEDLDLQSLALHVIETLVYHIQQKVAEKPAEKARYELDRFFQQTEPDPCKGWLLLKATYFLSANEAGVNAAIVTGLAAALVKCLYLFVSLPDKKSCDQEDDKCSFQDILIQVILQLCRQVRFVEQLVETEELQCAIIALTSLWDQCSASWRRQISHVLRAVSAAQICIQNMLKMSEHVHGLILAEVAVNVFSFVKDSYQNNPALFEEFENNDGYAALQAIMARCEEETSEEDFSPVQDLLSLIASFTLFGKAELKVALCVNNPQPPGFKFDPPLITGTAVKNLRAFQILQTSYLRSGSALTCSQILCTIHKIWSWDKANFFLLEWTLQCLAQLAESTWQKPAIVHGFFFKLLETVVFQLSYIPHDTLRKVQTVLKEGSSQAFSITALQCFHGMVRSSSLLADVLSDGGLMELLLVELRRQAKILRKAGISVNKGELTMEDFERQLTNNMLNVVAALAMRSIRNTVFIRDSGMIPYIKIFLDDEMYRSPTLCILEQLSEINPEEYMSTAIGAICSSTETELQLKQDLLHSILKVLDNPNSWNAFRTAGGFTSLLSMLVDMEGSLLQQPVGVWAFLSHQRLMELLLLTLHTIFMAVHLHPVNAHFFHISNLYERLAEALLQIGCFYGGAPVDLESAKDHRTFQDFLKLTESSGCTLPAPLQDSIQLLDFLEQFGTGISTAVDLCAELKESTEIVENQQEVTSTITRGEDFQGQIRKAALAISSVTVGSGRFTCDNKILHPGAIKVILTLLPHIYCPSNPQLSVELQLAVAHHVQSLVKSERNRQIMCESGSLETLLNHCRDILNNSTHTLHLPVVRILEKLASQSIDHKSLRTPVSLHQIISLVSITSPRSFRPYKVSVSPSFVEFDMTDNGYGCLFLPSLATVKGVSADSVSTGGIGSDCRGFPPSAGLSFSCWFLISRFSSACDSHPVRLLTLVRHMSRAEQHFSCLSVSISSADGCLVISTEEEAYQFLDLMEPMTGTPTTLPTTVRFKCCKQLSPGLWHHLVVTMAKDIKKSCKVTAYLNGEIIGTSKMRYIQPFPGPCVAMDASAVIDVCGIIGTPHIWKQTAALIWRVGPTYLFEEVLSSALVEIMYAQGTRYLGSYLALDIQEKGNFDFPSVQLVHPERISFGINPAVATITTVAEIRDQYNEVDCRLIAKELGIPSRDNSTPVFLARNISQHLSGTARTIGAALVGHFGVRKFTSNIASSSFQFIGGPAVVLSLVAMASDDSSLYAAVKVLLSVLDTNPAMKQEMKRISGYKLFAFLLKMKSHLISCRTFQLILAIVGTVELGTGNVYVYDLTALQGILCNFEVWQKAPEGLDLSVLNHLVEILKSSRLGLCLIHTLLPPTVDEKTEFPSVICEDQSLSQTPGRTIWIRNQLLEVLSSLIISDTPLPNNKQEEVFFILGSDWFLLFLQEHIHFSTVLLILKMLVHFLSHQNIRVKFKEAVSSGTLVENMHMRPCVIDNLQKHSWSYEYLSSTFPGFTLLCRLLLNHISLPQIYGAFAALLFGRSNFYKPNEQENLDRMLQSVIECAANEQGIQLCTEAACILMELPISGSEDSWDIQYPGSVMQFLCLVHSNYPRDALWASSEFLNSLASAVFPTEITENAAGCQSNEDTVDTSAPRLSHPARKQVCDFIRILLMDSLINIPAKDQHHPFIQLLEFSPDNVCQEQKQSFQTELLEFLIDIIYITGQEGGQSTHVVRDDLSTYSTEGTFTILFENVAFFSKMLVEKLYSGMFVVDPENLLIFLVEQISMVLERKHAQREATVSILYKSLNRTVLYFLSRPRQTLSEKELILRTLHVLQQHWDIIMATYNASVHFVSCLLHCLLLIRSGSFPEGFGCEMHQKTSKKIWRHLFPHKNTRTTVPVDIPNLAEVESELLKLVESMWDMIILERRQSLEEAYKIDLSAKQAGKETLVAMTDVSPLWEELAMKSWQTFIDSQKKKMNIGQRKISILSSRLHQRTPGKDPDSNVEMLQCENDLMAAQWLKVEEGLLWERGLFGPGPGVFIKQNWVQDTAEGPNRTRLRIRRKAARRSKKLPSLMPEQYTEPNTVDRSGDVTELATADAELSILSEPGKEQSDQEPSLDRERLTFFPTLTEVSCPTEDISEECKESQLIIQQLVPNEEIKVKQCVAVVSGHVLMEGVLMFGKADLYVCEGFTLTSSEDVYCGNHHPTSVRDSFICGMLKKEQSLVKPACRRWSYEDIKEAHFMRFLLEENAIEIFMKNGASVFLVFVNKDHVNAFKRLCTVVPSLKGRGVTEAVFNIR